jgi:predicted DNA-binding transcriptional regulator YafY
MRRADRLFQLVQLIRGRRLSTAQWLAKRLEVSERTVYRDIAQLQHQGVPIEGEAGVGYRLGKGFELPPLIFTTQEAQALVVLARMAQQWLDAGMAQSAEMVLSKVMSVLSPAQRHQASQTPLYAPPWGLTGSQQSHLQLWRQATQEQEVLTLHYRDAQEQDSQRKVWPLACFYWGKTWTLLAWCGSRQAFRSFRLDRLRDLQATGALFVLSQGQHVQDYLRLHGIEHADLQ